MTAKDRSDICYTEPMNAYIEAHARYVLCDREVEWTEAVDFHLQRGAVVALPGLFLMARRVSMNWNDGDHLDLNRLASAGDAWHVWAAAGDLRKMKAVAAAHRVRWVTYQRHDVPELRRVEIARLFKRVF